MQSLRKLVRKPRVDDWSPLAKFYYADEALNAVANELDSFDGRRDPERCNQLVTKLRQAQDRLLHIISEMMVIVFPREADRACRDYRVKFPEEIVHDNLPGQLWFGAECLTAGSNIIDHEAESEAIRPMARALTKHLDSLRDLLKDQSLRDPTQYSDKIKSSLKLFDHLFAEFELNYVSAMVPVKSVKEHDCQLDVAVLFSETLERALRLGYVTQEAIDDCDPNVMITVPRLAIVCGLLYFPDGALNVDGPADNLSDMFRPFHNLLTKIRDLLRVLDTEELRAVELALCSGDSAHVDGPMMSASTFTMSDFRQKSALRLSTSRINGTSTSHQATSYYASEESDEGDSADSPSPSRLAEDACTAVHHILSPTESASSLCDMQHCKADTQCENTVERPPDPANLRARFRSSADLVHRLFVCIAGVADQLQTNYPSDVRKVLKMVLQPNEVVPVYEVPGQTASQPVNEEETGVEVQEALPLPSFVGVRWVPDSDCEQCTACATAFTLVRRRHHCRNCGRIFCSRCSANSLPLPELGYDRKVRVCNLCFLYKINPFSPCQPQSQREQHRENDSSASSATPAVN
ncbi:Lateral signaling target protein 2 -like protein [Toxocara canis]|uniref:Lateral signaling target protein 2-like protein n=2 Tax=Toxocara canis TaxID=6265 RepID=A0A0B2V1Z6_TOXCA|nr:Lateral signaling target protein 2 -like protein [Toxocara canis]